ncbi:hypothetical protein [Streptomyces hesseae]|uniref:Zinc finger LSD1-type domain-containing protein n=1 Tax=Streptomyces hesseae TaxID=3075519 RepID=A0ABU2SS98_9ACTN|nr:hypothetical protein [Streptomyces sp. DSM 40473]MDT0451856.1 hypothetical protein [Streptomyces sp. DSM 40473]
MTHTDRPTCTVCTRPLWDAERHRYACRPCERRIADHLDQLPDLIHDLHGLLAPGSGRALDGPRTRASSEPQAPIRLHILDRIAAATATLDSWLADWHDHLEWTPPTYRADPFTEAATALRANLPWAVEQHAAVDDFAREIAELHSDATGLLDPARRARRIGHCPAPAADDPTQACGAVLRYVPGATTVTCRWCRTVWDAIDLGVALALAV